MFQAFLILLHAMLKLFRLFQAVVENEPSVVMALVSSDRGLVSCTDSQGWTAILVAVKCGHRDICDILLSHGAQVTSTTPDGSTVLHLIGFDDAELCETLLAHGAQVNAVLTDGTLLTPLHNAACFGHNKLIDILLQHRANPHAEDDEGWTPLHHACQNGYIDCVQTLCMAGVDITAVDVDGSAPIHYAADGNHSNIVMALVDRGCDMNMVDSEYSRTPLMSAARQGGVETVKVLLNKGADPDILDVNGETALSRAIKAEDSPTVELLAQMTNTSLRDSLSALARSSMSISPIVESFVARCARDSEAVVSGLKTASLFAHITILHLLTVYGNTDNLPADVLDNLLGVP